MKDKSTYIFYAPDLLLPVLAFAFIAYRLKSVAFTLLTIALFVFILFFFRPAGISDSFVAPDNTIVSPAQGRIMAIRKNATTTQISIFLSPLDVHVQYAPTAGKMIEQAYKEGEFNSANFFEKSQYNERLESTFMTTYGPIKVTQIAGQLARRIVSFLEPNQQVRAGEPIGLIKLGSRVDVFIPNTGVPVVNEGDRVFVGDVLANF
jgi:phosphatidylserine decarboxylase